MNQKQFYDFMLNKGMIKQVPVNVTGWKPYKKKQTFAKKVKAVMRRRQEEKSLFLGKNDIVATNGEFISPIVAGINQNLFRVNQVDQGDASNQREGLEIEAVKLQLRIRSWYYQTPSLTSGSQTTDSKRFRVIVFWYNQSDNNVLSDSEYPQRNEMFETNGALLLPTSTVDGVINHTFRQNFKIVFDKVYKVGNQQDYVHTFKRDINLKNKKVKYTSSSIGATTPIADALFVLIVTDNPVGSGSASNQIVKHDATYNFIFREL